MVVRVSSTTCFSAVNPFDILYYREYCTDLKMNVSTALHSSESILTRIPHQSPILSHERIVASRRDAVSTNRRIEYLARSLTPVQSEV